MSPDTRWMSSITAPTAGSAAKTTAAPAGPAPAAPPVEPARSAAAPPPDPLQATLRSVRAAAIRARTWQAAWWLALSQPRVATLEGLAANPAASLERALRWCLAGAAVGYALPAVFSLARGAAPLPTVLWAYALLMGLTVTALAAGPAVAVALAAHLAAYGLRPRPHLLEREPLAPAPGGLTPGLFQPAIYVRLAFACAAFAAPLTAALGAALVLPDLLRGLLLFAFSLYALLLSVLAVRAACRVSWTWAIVAGVAGALTALLPLAAVAGAWVGLNS